jgi:aryl-alcohol dehydrogenase-like predicted oxidoreductase
MVFYWGTSEWPADEITEACGIAKELRMVAAVAEQPLYNIFLIIRNSRESFKDFTRGTDLG